MLLVVCLIAESMGQLIETGITDLGLPSSLAGVLVAMLILAPEALNAIQAASAGEVQRSINRSSTVVVATVVVVSLTWAFERGAGAGHESPTPM